MAVVRISGLFTVSFQTTTCISGHLRPDRYPKNHQVRLLFPKPLPMYLQKRVRSLEDRERMLDDAEYRALRLADFQRRAQLREFAEFVINYDLAYQAAEMTDAFLSSAVGVFFPILTDVTMFSTKDMILKTYGPLYGREHEGGPLYEIEAVEDWPGDDIVFAYHPKTEEYNPSYDLELEGGRYV